MKDFFANAITWLVLLIFTIGAAWAAITNFQTGHYIMGLLCAFGALLFGLPLISYFLPKGKKKEKEDTVQVTIIPLPTDKDKLEALAIQLIDDDKPLMDTILESLAHPQAFYEHKAKTVGEDEIDYEAFWIDAKNNIDTLSSVGMLYLLSDANVVRSVDPKEGLDNFLWNIECLKRVQLHHLTIEKALLNNTLDILHCCDIINKQWEPTGFQLALIDDDSSDSTITVVPIGWKGIS